MSVLQLDIGNTALKWRLRAQGRTMQQGYLLTRNINPETLQQELPKGIQHVACANVAGNQIQNWICNWAVQQEAPCFIAHSQSRFGDLVNSYAEPHRMGVDRWLAMVGARQRSHNPLCVVDCGSAVTLDYIATSGHHLGGYILPGSRLMMESLIRSTCNIVMDPVCPANAITPGKDTQQSVSHGVKRLLHQGLQAILQTAISEGFELQLTGGEGHVLADTMQQAYFADLVLEGLELVQQYGR
jgi:type III pantothenate kinase